MNSYIQSDETEIDLLDLAKYLLRRIVWILLAGVVCAGIAGLYKYQSMRSAHPDPDAAAQAETEYERNLTKYEEESELINAADAVTLDLIRNQENYLRTSPYMKLDPYHVWKAQAMIQVNSLSEDFPAYQMEELYKFELANVDYLSGIAKKFGTEAAYLKEMVGSWSIGSPVGTGDSTSDVILREEDYDARRTSKVFCAQALGDSEAHATELLDVMLEEVQAVYEESVKKYPHEMKVISRGCSETVDTGIRAAQRDHVTYTQTLLYQMKDNSDKAALLSKPEEVVAVQDGSVSRKDLIKFAVIGFVIGVLLMCLWHALRYILNDRLVDYKDIARKGIHLKDLGSMSGQGADVVAANIRNFAGERKKLFITGMASDAEFAKVCSSLQGKLADYEVIFAGHVLEDPKAKDLLLSCDAVVLVEQAGTTRYSRMKAEITFLVNADKEIVGIVIV